MTSLLLLKSVLFANVLQKTKKKKKNKSKKKVSFTTIDLNMCRICHEEKGLIPIFDNFTYPNIPDEIKHFSGVTINRADSLPKLMCQNCLNLLNGCIIFRDMCQTNNKMMIELSIKKEAEINNEDANSRNSEDSFNITSPAYSEDNSEIWGCTTCNKNFYDMESYNTHLSECKNENMDVPKTQDDKSKKNFLCDICGKTARSNANLVIHIAVASLRRLRNFLHIILPTNVELANSLLLPILDYADACYLVVSDEHLNRVEQLQNLCIRGIHENVFPFKCDECPYQGRTMDLLKVHKRTHMVDKPFKCTQCPKSTTTSSNLAKHMRHVHSTTRPFKCTYCEKAFSYQHDMKRHIRDIHLRQGTVECDVCCKKFNTKKILQGHRWKIHKIKGERHGRLPSYLQCQQEED